MRPCSFCGTARDSYARSAGYPRAADRARTWVEQAYDDELLAEVGELEPWYNPRTKRREYRLVLPKQCANGHPLQYPNIHLTHRGCQCAGRQGHTVVICRECSDEQLLPPCSAVS